MPPTAPHRTIVAITGGARGIGRAIALRLAEAGAVVAIGDRDLDAARATAAEYGGTAWHLDVTSRASFSEFLDGVTEHFGRIDVLVNNAGVMRVGDFDSESDRALDRQIAVNVRGVMNGVRLAAPAMRERGAGHLVTIASAASLLAPPGEAGYAATKHAVLGYLRAVRAELYGSGVAVSIVMPGVVDTELAAGTAPGAVRRLRADEVAAAVAAVIRRPRPEITVPRRIGVLARILRLLPIGLADRIQRATVPDQRRGDPRRRSGYERDVLGE